MNKPTIYTLKVLRRIYKKAYGTTSQKPTCLQDADKASLIIYNALTDDKPCMIARFGSTELTCLCNYFGIKQQNNRLLDYIKGEIHPWWWEQKIINQMQQWSGFFPPDSNKLEQFCELMINDIPQVDVLGSWLAHEMLLDNYLKAKKIHLRILEPFWSATPWSLALEGKKVLVVHPFNQTIEEQYKKRKLLFSKNILPDFELKTIKAVQSIAGERTPFKDWFEALEYMKLEINKVDYDICLIGAGAYGFHLAAHVKRLGKKGFHLGGSLQLLFGIRGKRWEDPNYGVKEWGIPKNSYTSLLNEHWVRPNENEKPNGAIKVEGACYW